MIHYRHPIGEGGHRVGESRLETLKRGTRMKGARLFLRIAGPLGIGATLPMAHAAPPSDQASFGGRVDEIRKLMGISGITAEQLQRGGDLQVAQRWCNTCVLGVRG